MAKIKVLLFDLGGVLLRLNNPGETFDLHISESEFLERWIHSPAVREFERGAIDAESFAKSIVLEVELPYDWRKFLEKFEALPVQLFPGIAELLDIMPPHYRRVLLSNTNAIHWHRTGVADELAHRFENVYLSYVTGRLKPDTNAFQLVQDELGCEMQQIVFFDDNPANILAAKEIGCRSFLTRGVDELRASLGQLGVIA
jgi:HAD superfamily hydrolase (TIGR01509 family)